VTGTLLARPGIDLGLPTDNEKARRGFYEQLGLSHLKTDTIMAGQDEVYYTLHDSWLKIITSDQSMPVAVSGYDRLLIVDPMADDVNALVDPDGLKVDVVPPGYRGIDQIGVVLKVNDIAAQERFLVMGMGAKPAGSAFRVGNTMFFLESADPSIVPGPMFACGFTMVSLIVCDIVAAHAALLAAGASHGLRICEDPIVPGRCLFSFIRDPNGNWIELVQFEDLSGPLPKPNSPPPSPEEFLSFRDHGVPT
jgi:lactoylglutathione lyase